MKKVVAKVILIVVKKVVKIVASLASYFLLLCELLWLLYEVCIG